MCFTVWVNDQFLDYVISFLPWFGAAVVVDFVVAVDISVIDVVVVDVNIVVVVAVVVVIVDVIVVSVVMFSFYNIIIFRITPVWYP